jgi:hypothetical protein
VASRAISIYSCSTALIDFADSSATAGERTLKEEAIPEEVFSLLNTSGIFSKISFRIF